MMHQCILASYCFKVEIVAIYPRLLKDVKTHFFGKTSSTLKVTLHTYILGIQNPIYNIRGRIMCNWLKSIGDWKSIGNFFDKNSEIFLQFTLLVVNHVDWVKSIAINESQLELP